MKAPTISDSEAEVQALQNELRRSAKARYDHRLHAVLLVVKGLKCPEVASLLGDSSRSVQYWVRRFKEEGVAGLADADRPGRPTKLNDEQFNYIGKALGSDPNDFGLKTNSWDGKTLSEFIRHSFNIDIGVRQCQRLFRKFGFRPQKPGLFPSLNHIGHAVETNSKE